MVQQLCSFLASSSNMTVMEIVLISALTRDLRALQSHVHRSILAAPETSRPSSFVLCHFVAVAITSNVGASERTSRNSSLSLFINVFNRFADGCFVGASLQFTNVFTFSMISSFCCVSSLQPEGSEFRGVSLRQLPCVFAKARIVNWSMRIMCVPWFNLSSLHKLFRNNVAAPSFRSTHFLLNLS